MLLTRTGARSSSQTEFPDYVQKCILQEEEKLSKETIETKPTSTATKSARAVKEEPVEEKKTSTISNVKNNSKGTLKMATPVTEEVKSDYVKVIELQEHVNELVTVVGTLLTRMDQLEGQFQHLANIIQQTCSIDCRRQQDSDNSCNFWRCLCIDFYIM